MALILSLDTSTKVCSVAVHSDGDLIGHQAYHLQKSHSSLLPEIIKQVVENCEITLQELNAIAISEGPGSYTGLRIGTATAKGLAYALDLPLIAVSSLDSMLDQVISFGVKADLFCPMIDARRMEVYCKLVDSANHDVWDTRPLVVDAETFNGFSGRQIALFGNGSDKLKDVFSSAGYLFIDNVHPSAASIGSLAHKKYLDNDLVDVAYFEPEYLKDFKANTPSQKTKL